jgi:uncharacterized phage protein (TIGR01671 family)
MREIEFRGKHQQNNEWVYGFYYLDHPHKNPKIIDGDRAIYVYPETVGQYTGLKDRKGKKVYEGDLVAYDKDLWEIRHSTVGCCLEMMNTNKPGRLPAGIIMQSELFGNIHDSPELLNGKGAE